jgi:hypothetical protein
MTGKRCSQHLSKAVRSHAAPNAVPAVFERRVGEQSRVAGFIWRLPRSNGLHHPAYNFNDDAIIYGTLCWIKLVEMILAARCASADAARDGVCRRSGFGFNALS